jgi:hypothetical protein
MVKVTIIFDCRIKLWEFKQVLHRKVLRTIFWKRSITCFCTEAEIELARLAYHARIEEAK